MIIKNIHEIQEKNYGTKANNVIEMYHAGIVVPKSWVISHNYIVEKMEEYLGISLDSKEIDRCVVENFFKNFPMDLYNEIYIEVINLINSCENGTRFVVRSSHLIEDGKEYSFSGLFTTELNLSKAVNIVEAIISCWMNCFCEGINQYLDISNNKKFFMPCAILIQEFIPSESAGVMFKIGSNYYINSTWGMAKSIVDGSTGFDSWAINDSGEVTGYQNSKDFVTVPVFALTNPSSREYFLSFVSDEQLKVEEFNNLNNYVQVELSALLKKEQSLNSQQRNELLEVCTKLSEMLRISDCDIEWACSKGQLYILQCRSITRTIIDNSKTTNAFLPLVGGIAQGKCIYVETENEAKSFPKGAILVAKRIVGPVLLAATKASGCILESKSPLSHSAIIARELGIPAVGAVDPQLLEMGEDYEIDGEKGTIVKIRKSVLKNSQVCEERVAYDADNPNVRILKKFIQKYML